MRALVLSITLTAVATASYAQEQPQKLETQRLADNFYLITGPGGNIALLIGKTSVLLVDDQIASMTPTLKKTIAQITPKPVRFVVNTHWHGDHTGGNAVLGQEGAVIVAHENVRKRLSTEQFTAMMKRKVPAAAESAWPVVTFSESMSLHVDGEDIDIIHVDPAHTDGDAIVWFKHANVVHMGDTYFSSGYPFIDLGSGGTSEGYIRAADRVLAMAQPSTRIIPGHGAITDRKQLKVFRDMIKTIRDRVASMVKQGKALDAVQTAKPTAEYDVAWGKAFIKPEQMVEFVYRDLSRGH